jgi:hypothetical protein
MGNALQRLHLLVFISLFTPPHCVVFLNGWLDKFDYLKRNLSWIFAIAESSVNNNITDRQAGQSAALMDPGYIYDQSRGL